MEFEPFDFSELRPFLQAQEEGIEIVIPHPLNGKPICAITMAGPDSKKARMANRWASNEVIRQRVESGRTKIGEEFPWTDEDEDLFRLHILAGSLISWKAVTIDGREPEATKENALRFFEEFPYAATICANRLAVRSRFIEG